MMVLGKNFKDRWLCGKEMLEKELVERNLLSPSEFEHLGKVLLKPFLS